MATFRIGCFRAWQAKPNNRARWWLRTASAKVTRNERTPCRLWRAQLECSETIQWVCCFQLCVAKSVAAERILFFRLHTHTSAFWLIPCTDVSRKTVLIQEKNHSSRMPAVQSHLFVALRSKKFRYGDSVSKTQLTGHASPPPLLPSHRHRVESPNRCTEKMRVKSIFWVQKRVLNRPKMEQKGHETTSSTAKRYPRHYNWHFSAAI